MPEDNYYTRQALSLVRQAIGNVAAAHGQEMMGGRKPNTYRIDSILSNLTNWADDLLGLDADGKPLPDGVDA